MNNWTSTAALTLGNREIDKAHQLLFDELARLAEVADAALEPAFAHFVKRLETDFRLEEDAMTQLPSPMQRAHIGEHAHLLGRLHHAAAALERADPLPARRTLQELPQWLAMHIESMDITLANATPASSRSSN